MLSIAVHAVVIAAVVIVCSRRVAPPDFEVEVAPCIVTLCEAPAAMAESGDRRAEGRERKADPAVEVGRVAPRPPPCDVNLISHCGAERSPRPTSQREQLRVSRSLRETLAFHQTVAPAAMAEGGERKAWNENPETRNPERETRNEKPETRNEKPETASVLPIVQSPEPMTILRPRYPLSARRHGWEGEVRVQAQIGVDGVARDVGVEQSSGHEVLDSAACAAVREATFRPGIREGQAVPAQVLLPIVFRLRK